VRPEPAAGCFVATCRLALLTAEATLPRSTRVDTGTCAATAAVTGSMSSATSFRQGASASSDTTNVSEAKIQAQQVRALR
jgi:hypothetical protein